MENRLSVVPVLETTARLWSTKFIHLTCNTKSELQYNLALLCKRNYGILYLAFHGVKGAIELHDGTPISLADLSQMMGARFSGWIIHFGSCDTIKNEEQVYEFMAQTGVALVTGYQKPVDWGEGAALEILFFQALQKFKSLSALRKHLHKKFPDLIRATGFRFFPDDLSD